jgi:alkylhydroperoxidase family enzyme
MSPIARKLAVVFPLFLVTGCGGAGDAAGDPAALAVIERERGGLDAERRALAALGTQLATIRAAGSDPTEVEDRIETRKAELDRLASQLDQHLVDYLNAHRPRPGEPLTLEQRRVLDVKIAEDLAVAKEFIEEGGDYAHAIQIYRDLLALEPDSAPVLAALASAEARRTMTSERFAALRKGMTRDQVRTALGLPHLKNIQDFAEQGVVAWFYPTDQGGTAGVYFERDSDDEEPRVYRWDYAVPSRPSTLAAHTSAPATSAAASQ